jgi:predicted transcriptional regulator
MGIHGDPVPRWVSLTLGPGIIEEKGGCMEIGGIIRKKDIEQVERDCTVADAVKLMVRRNVGSLIVRRRESSEAYGIVTRQDILFKVLAKGLDLHKMKVKEIMSSPVVILNNIHLDIRHAAQAMANTGVTNIVVFDSGDLYGFLSSTDIVDAMAADLVRQSLNSQSNDVSGGC